MLHSLQTLCANLVHKFVVYCQSALSVRRRICNRVGESLYVSMYAERAVDEYCFRQIIFLKRSALLITYLSLDLGIGIAFPLTKFHDRFLRHTNKINHLASQRLIPHSFGNDPDCIPDSGSSL